MENVEEIISLEIMKNTVKRLQNKIANGAVLRNEVKYHGEALNASFEGEFNAMISVLQSVVDKFYHSHYEVLPYCHFSEKNFSYALERNNSTLKSMEKLLKFVA